MMVKVFLLMFVVGVSISDWRCLHASATAASNTRIFSSNSDFYFERGKAVDLVYVHRDR